MVAALKRPAMFRYAALFARDRKSTRLNSSHVAISYAVFCLKKKIHLVAPTSPPPRERLLARRSPAVIYVVPVSGATGESREIPVDLAASIDRLLLVKQTPVR